MNRELIQLQQEHTSQEIDEAKRKELRAENRSQGLYNKQPKYRIGNLSFQSMILNMIL